MPMSDFIHGLRRKVGTDLLLVPAVNAIVVNDAGQVLLQRASIDGLWCIPGGGIDPGEQPADAAAREVLEETGLLIEPYRLVGTFMEEPMVYANGDRAQYLVIVFLCRIVGGVLGIHDDESLELRFFNPADMPQVKAPHRGRVEQALAGHHGIFVFQRQWRG